MECLYCKHFEFLSNKKKDTYGFCNKQKKKVVPFEECIIEEKGIAEKRAIKIYINNYKTKKLDEIATMIGDDWNKATLSYFIDKRFLPRKSWEKKNKTKRRARNQVVDKYSKKGKKWI